MFTCWVLLLAYLLGVVMVWRLLARVIAPRGNDLLMVVVIGLAWPVVATTLLCLWLVLWDVIDAF